MKIFPIIITIAIALFSCNGGSDKGQQVDSLMKNGKKISAAQWKKEWIDSTTAAVEKTSIIDTAGHYNSPVKIIASKLTRKAYSNYRSMWLKYKNVSQKKITGIKFSWYGTNAFGDPADMGNPILKGYGGGFTDEDLGSGKTAEGSWNILSSDGKQIILAWPYEIVFSDGTKWYCGRRSIQ